MLRGFFGNLIFAIIARMLCGNRLNFDQKRYNTSNGFRALFVYCISSKNYSFLSVFSEAAFLSFTFFSSDSQLCVVGFLRKQLFSSGLLDMIITTHLVGYIQRACIAVFSINLQWSIVNP